MACKILHSKLVKLIQDIYDDVVPITLSETIMENSCKIVLENERLYNWKGFRILDV